MSALKVILMSNHNQSHAPLYAQAAITVSLRFCVLFIWIIGAAFVDVARRLLYILIIWCCLHKLPLVRKQQGCSMLQDSIESMHETIPRPTFLVAIFPIAVLSL